MVRWEIVTLSATGPFKLSVMHSKGAIVEYFTTAAAALRREQEIEGLFLTSTTGEPATTWVS